MRVGFVIGGGISMSLASYIGDAMARTICAMAARTAVKPWVRPAGAESQCKSWSTGATRQMPSPHASDNVYTCVPCAKIAGPSKWLAYRNLVSAPGRDQESEDATMSGHCVPCGSYLAQLVTTSFLFLFLFWTWVALTTLAYDCSYYYS